MTAVKRNEIQKKEYPQEEGIWSYIGKNEEKKTLGEVWDETECVSKLHNKFKLMNICPSAYIKNRINNKSLWLYTKRL